MAGAAEMRLRRKGGHESVVVRAWEDEELWRFEEMVGRAGKREEMIKGTKMMVRDMPWPVSRCGLRCAQLEGRSSQCRNQAL